MASIKTLSRFRRASGLNKMKWPKHKNKTQLLWANSTTKECTAGKSKFLVKMQHTRMKFAKIANKKQSESIMQREHSSATCVDLSKKAHWWIWRKKIEISRRRTTPKKSIVERVGLRRLIKWTIFSLSLLGVGRILGLTTRISKMEWERREARRSTTKRRRKTGSKIGSKQWKRSFI